MERAGDLLEAFLKLHNISGGEEYVAFFKSWHNIVGTDIASHTQLTDIKNGALKVEVDHPGWMQKLHMKKEQVLRKVAAQYPQLEIRTLHLRLVSEFSSRAPSPQSEASSSHPSAPRRSGHSAAESTHGGGGPAGDDSEEAAGSGEPSEDREASKNAKQALNRIEDEKLKNTLSRLYEDLKDNDDD
ncbi:MAG: DUF721 domain-containing protein [Spirochaetota bacterium]